MPGGCGSTPAAPVHMLSRIPCIIFEDTHLLAVNKPAGIGTHRPGELTSWGLVEVLQAARRDLPTLGIHQRLDRETSGVILFAKTAAANRSLAVQFEERKVHKTYFFITGAKSSQPLFTATDAVDGRSARTEFRLVRELEKDRWLWQAHPETGRTHQVREHAGAHGIAIIGDNPAAQTLKTPLLLHAGRLQLSHPETGAPLVLEAEIPDYFYLHGEAQRLKAALRLRLALLDPAENTAYRMLHREADGYPGLTLDRLGEWGYLEDYRSTPGIGIGFDVDGLCKDVGLKGVVLSHALQGQRREQKSILCGNAPMGEVEVLENGMRFSLDLLAAGGTGLFLDQRENRRKLAGLSQGKRVLNLFAYTCAFSVAAASGGARESVSVDVSRRVLEWGRRNFIANGLDPARHQFWPHDAEETLRRFRTRKERFDIVVIDPPSFSHSKTGGAFSIKRDLKKLIVEAVGLLSNEGYLLASTNLAEWKAEAFLECVLEAVGEAKRRVIEKIWAPQPFDFPVMAGAPGHLKSVWVKLE